MDQVTTTVSLRTVEYKPDGSVTFKFSSGDIGSASDDDAISFALSSFNDIDKLLKSLLILNYYQYGEAEQSALASSITPDSWIQKNGPI